jgi:hypothetical protein
MYEPMLLTIVHKKSTLKRCFLFGVGVLLSPNLFDTGFFTGKSSKIEDS